MSETVNNGQTVEQRLYSALRISSSTLDHLILYDTLHHEERRHALKKTGKEKVRYILSGFVWAHKIRALPLLLSKTGACVHGAGLFSYSPQNTELWWK